MNEGPLLIVDLEATCWENRGTRKGDPQSIRNMEIIEFGCALATRAGELLDSMSFLVRPAKNPQLSEFCTTLTSITQPAKAGVEIDPEDLSLRLAQNSGMKRTDVG